MSAEAPIRVVLADDHIVVRQGLKRLLDRVPEIKVVGEASDGLEALQTVEQLKPDVLLLDIEMPGMDGVEVTRRLRALKFDVRILILSAYDDQEYIQALLDIGVSGYLVKGEAPKKIIEVVSEIARNQKGGDSPQENKNLEKMQSMLNKRKILTFGDVEILRMLSSGVSEAEIARQLKTNEKDVHTMLDDLYKKLGVISKDFAVEMAQKEGWIR